MKAVLLLAASLAVCYAKEKSGFKPSSVRAPFVEQFTPDWDSRWKPSGAIKKMPEGYKVDEKENAEDLFRYRGEWVVEKALTNGLPDDKGLVAKTAAAHHAISASFPKVVDPDGKDLVVQYDVKFQEELQCGGAYIKLLTESNEGIKHNEFDDRTPYTIMFGPDKCGSTNKVHFIFRHKNPRTGAVTEKHFLHAPSIKSDTNTNLYSLVVHPNNTFEMYINLEKAKSGNLLEDFEPAVNPPREIDDKTDKKPEDWVDEPKIPDPDATKPDDWDEEAPRMIEDGEATKPEDWLEDEPEQISDPDAEQPEDWDDEEDGKWVAPVISNPKCEKVSGCGKWKPPTKPNPNYKGKWYPPLIDNPKYKGAWAPRKIANPDFYEDLAPSKFTKIMGVGIEIWTMQAGIMYDNFYVGHSWEDAKRFAAETWQLKHDLEVKAEESQKKANEEAAGKKEASKGDPAKEFPQLKESYEPTVATLRANVAGLFEQISASPVDALKAYPVTAFLVLLVILSPTLIYAFLTKGSSKEEFGKRKKIDEKVAAEKSPKKTAANEDNETEKTPAEGVRKRRTNKDE